MEKARWPPPDKRGGQAQNESNLNPQARRRGGKRGNRGEERAKQRPLPTLTQSPTYDYTLVTINTVRKVTDQNTPLTSGTVVGSEPTIN